MKVNQSPADKYTAAHFGAGVLAGLGKVPPVTALLGAVIFELVEDELLRRTPGIFRDGGAEVKANALLDVAAFGVGYMLAR